MSSKPSRIISLPVIAQASAQRGVALIISLSMMLILTVVGMSTMEIGALDTRSVASLRDTQVAFQTAESALRAGEGWIDEMSETFGEPHAGDTVSGGIFVSEAGFETREKWWEDDAVWTGNGVAVDVEGGLDALGAAASEPLYIVEAFSKPLTSSKTAENNRQTGQLFYRITAKGYGFDSSTYVVLQTTYAISLN